MMFVSKKQIHGASPYLQAARAPGTRSDRLYHQQDLFEGGIGFPTKQEQMR